MAKRVLDHFWCHWGLSSNPRSSFIQRIFALAKYFKQPNLGQGGSVHAWQHLVGPQKHLFLPPEEAKCSEPPGATVTGPVRHLRLESSLELNSSSQGAFEKIFSLWPLSKCFELKGNVYEWWFRWRLDRYVCIYLVLFCHFKLYF